MRRFLSLSLACTLAALSLAGCTRAPDQAPAPDALASSARDAAPPSPADSDAPALPMPGRPTPTSGEAVPPGAWSLQESDPPRAVWGPPDSEGILGFGCERAGGKLLLDRQAVGVGDDVRLVSIEADGTRIDYPAERVDAVLAPLLLVRIAPDAAIVDRLLQARRMAVTAGGDTIHAPAPGGSLRAVVEACRRDPAG